MMDVSIVIPAYNEAPNIAQTLKAALDQDYGGTFEIIVVDNASTDGTGDVARQFPVTVIREERKGILHAREAGRKEARGDIIVQLDADSIPPRSWISRGLKYFRDSSVVCVSGPYRYWDGTRSFRWVSFTFQMVFFWPTHQLLSPFKLACIGTGGNMFIRASTLEQIGGYDTTILFYGEDTNTARRLMEIGKVLYAMPLYVDSSARRFKDMGIATVLWLYTLNWVKEIKPKPMQQIHRRLQQ